MQKKIGTVILSMLILILFAGCTSENSTIKTTNEPSAEQKKDDGKAQKSIASAEPVTIKIFLPGAGWLTDAEFQQFVVDPVKKRHPNITIVRLGPAPITAQSLQEMLSKGDNPDIIITSSVIMDPLKEVGFLLNHEPLIKQSNINLDRFEAGSLQAVINSSGGEFLGAIPYSSNLNALYYNKDIFDKFGIAYPKDGMTWEDTIELAKKLTRNDDGVQYKGLHPQEVWRSASQLGLGFVDPRTNKAIVNTDSWKRVFEMYKTIFSIPGNENDVFGGEKLFDQFMKNKTLAMLASNNQLNRFGAVPDLHWDLAAYPSFKEAPGKGMQYDLHVMAVTANSKNKDAAFQVISTITSDEVQLQLSRNGRVSVLKDEKMRKEFANNLPNLKGKNLQAVFKTTPVPNAAPTEFDTFARSLLSSKVTQEVLFKGTDINTALRQAEEEINSNIETTKLK